MNFFDAFILGIVQGVAEFLPISSSGHLVLFHKLLSIEEGSLFFDTMLHWATLLAIIIFFYKDILRINIAQIKAIVVGTIPAVLVGLFFKDQVESLFSSLTLVSFALLFTGGLNIWTDRKLNKMADEKQSDEMDWKKGFKIGLFQALAITPGISRSGSTLAGGIWQNLSRSQAFTFSFLLAIPAIAGAGILQLKDVLETGDLQIQISVLLVGMLSAFISGILSLKLFSYVMDKARLEWFGYYCLVVGGVSLVVSYI